ncbi:unnamed protein product [Lactuca virosa]|uniref:Uncharacterized protein n=1 Tax=Lactuca virosa TaxID=75947 RepID=A0AAU9MN18_9ASTR|nr:unnamed protein product [Lactuca virosa]
MVVISDHVSGDVEQLRWALRDVAISATGVAHGKKGNDKRNTSLVSPCPVNSSVLPTPIFSPSRDVLVDMAKEEWGVDGYGLMKGLIRLLSPGNDEEDEEGRPSEGDVEEHLEVERREYHDLSIFEMIYPNYNGAGLIDFDLLISLKWICYLIYWFNFGSI